MAQKGGAGRRPRGAQRDRRPEGPRREGGRGWERGWLEAAGEADGPGRWCGRGRSQRSNLGEMGKRGLLEKAAWRHSQGSLARVAAFCPELLQPSCSGMRFLLPSIFGTRFRTPLTASLTDPSCTGKRARAQACASPSRSCPTALEPSRRPLVPPQESEGCRGPGGGGAEQDLFTGKPLDGSHFPPEC